MSKSSELPDDAWKQYAASTQDISLHENIKKEQISLENNLPDGNEPVKIIENEEYISFFLFIDTLSEYQDDVFITIRKDGQEMELKLNQSDLHPDIFYVQFKIKDVPLNLQYSYVLK